MSRFVDDIRRALNEGTLPERFTAGDARAACPGWAKVTYTSYLNRHCLGNPDGNTVYFMKHARGLYSVIG